MILSWRERQDRIEARGAECRAGVMSEAAFEAYLFSMHLRGEDLRHKMREFAPPAPTGPTYEEARLEASRQWLKEYCDGKAR